MSSTKMRGLFDKNSVPPPAAGRGPNAVPKPAGVAPPAVRLPEPRGLPTDNEVTVNAAFPLLPDNDAQTTAATEDPIAHLFDADPPRPSQAGGSSARAQVASAEAATNDAVSSPDVDDASDAVVLEAGVVEAGAQDSIPPDESAANAVRAATEESFASLFTSEPPPEEPRHVARVELTRATPGSAQEIAAADFSRDPRSEESIRPRSERESSTAASPVEAAAAPVSSGLFPESEADLQGVVFDPDQSVARHLGEVAIDSELGPAAQSEALRDLPLPQVPAPLGLDDGVSDKPPVRSMRPALIVMALLMVSGGAMTLGSLGVLDEDPAEYRREAAEARKSREAPPPAVAPTPPTTPKAGAADPPKAAAAQHVPVQAAPSLPEVPAEGPTVVAAVPEAAPAAEAVATKAPVTPEPPITEEATQRVVVSGDPVAAGDTLFRDGDLDAALVQYEAGLRADSKDHHAMEGLARIHLARGNAEQALPFAEQMVKRRPKRAAYRVLHGQALLGVGDRTGARRAFQEALTLEPGNSEARRLLGS